MEKNNAGFRKLPGTNLKNVITGEVIYTPPQEHEAILRLMNNLEEFINDDTKADFDPIVKMAIIHFQFESIHPFYDGNGRAGRIINILYLVMKDLLELPILYLSQYIIAHKGEYYRLLQKVREMNEWEDWILFIIDAVKQMAIDTIHLVKMIKTLMMEYKVMMRENYKFYSHELLNNLFMHPYTKIEFVMKELETTRITAANYLNKMADDGLLKKEKLGTANYYVNTKLVELLTKRPIN